MGFFQKFNYKSFGIVMILSLVLVTILSTMISNFSDIDVLKTGPSFFLLFISVFLIYFFVAVSDGKIDKKEIWTMIFIAVALVGSGWVLNNYFPEIFSAFPEQIKQTFSTWGIK